MNKAVTCSTTPAATTPTYDVSAMTGASSSTRSSKANAYASGAVKDVTHQYTAQFAKMQEEIDCLQATQRQSVGLHNPLDPNRPRPKYLWGRDCCLL